MRTKLLVVLVSWTALAALPAVSADSPKPRPAAQCVDASSGRPVDCVPATYTTFDIPFAKLPGARMNAKGELDPTSSPADAHAGAFVAAQKLGLFRNFKWVHWIPTAPSTKDPKTGKWSGGDLDGFPTGWGSTGLGIAGDCLYWGRSNSTNTTGPGVTREVKIFRIQPDPEKDAPLEVGTMPQLTVDNGQTAVRDRELRPYNYTSTDGVDRMLMVRSAATGTGGDVITYTVDPKTCLPTDNGYKAKGVLAHEFYLWHDPLNPNRLLVLSQTYGSQDEDLIVTAITDEKTGLVLKEPIFLASFTLENIGGPLRNERPDATGLYQAGRFADYSQLTDQWGRPGASQPAEVNSLHSGTLSDDGERFYVAGTTAGMYILNTEKIAQSTNAQLATGSICHQRSSNAWVDGKVGGVVDVHKLPAVAEDCVHPVLNSDPGVLAMLRSDRTDADKLARYTRLETRSRFAFTPPLVAMVGVHSAVPVPNRPSLTRGNVKKRPAWVVITEEWPFGPCPERGLRIINVESEITPMMVGALAQSDSMVEKCLAQPRPPGALIRPMMHAHNPTVLPDLIFVGWLGHGVRAIDISNPFNPREVGHARPIPWGDIMTYPDIHNGLIYVGDNNSGLHVLKYTGPHADEVPQHAIYSSNRTSPHPSGPPRSGGVK
ncbi:MAG TPA: hypothetical protein VLW26_13670 [Steroidobacteraceae bacterium]|nr:hypothetical protein [Steroidobacteraceae bacterium]